METLTQAVMAYKESENGWRALQDRISLFVYRYPGKWAGWDEDKCSDFFLMFFPKIPGIVKRYQPKYQFETYLSNSLAWSMKTFTGDQANREHYESWTVEISEEDALIKSGLSEPEQTSRDNSDLEQSYDISKNCPFDLEANGRLKDPALRRRILYAVLLRAADLDDHRIPFIATLVDVDSDWLFERTRTARDLVFRKITRRETLRNRRNEYWYHLERARKRLESVHDSERRDSWEKKTENLRRRYLSVSRGIRSLHITTSHKDIGRLLSTPPGTVSSGLHLLRKKWHAMEHWTSKDNPG